MAKARETANITVSDMADQLRVSRGTISNYEHGRTDPNVATLMAWSQITKVSLWWLLGEESRSATTSDGYDDQPPLTLFEHAA